MIDVRRILCPIDFDGFSERALRYAVRMAHWYGATLHVLHVRPPQTTSSAAVDVRDAELATLESLVDRYRLPHVEISTELVESAEPADAIIASADARDVDLIVTGSHGRSGVQRVLLGSVVEGLLHRCGRPILTIPSHLNPLHAVPAAGFSHVLCAVDFSAASIDALAYALSIAEESEAQLSVLHVIEKLPELVDPLLVLTVEVEQIRLAAEAQKLAQLRALVPEDAREYCSIDTAVLEGGASRHILHRAAESQVDLIVLGVHGRSTLDLVFFGSNSKDVIRQAQCPVLIVPARCRATITAAAS
jgi:nucleotide-binding universal stress UspA family protein